MFCQVAADVFLVNVKSGVESLLELVPARVGVLGLVMRVKPSCCESNHRSLPLGNT